MSLEVLLENLCSFAGPNSALRDANSSFSSFGVDNFVNALLLASLHCAMGCGLEISEFVEIHGKFRQSYWTASGCSVGNT